MRIDEIRVHPVRLPFRVGFSHSCTKGVYSDNVVVEVVSDGGKVRGYGEGAPRPYVTGESHATAASSIRHLAGLGAFPWEVRHVSAIWAFVDSLPDGKEHNAALCALETAMLDALARAQHCAVMDYFPSGFATDRVFYGAVLPLAGKGTILEMSRIIQAMGIRRVKVKLGRDFEENRGILEGVSQVFEGACELKADANGAWGLEAGLAHIPLLEQHGVSIVEQPMMPKDPGQPRFSDEARRHGLRVMADESACSMGETLEMLGGAHFDIMNVRLSKCGGFRRSLRIVELLRSRKTPFQVACQLGESGVLSAAGRTLSLLCGDALYHDGSYDRHLLRENITKEDVTFGYGGGAGRLAGEGLGVEVDPVKLKGLRCSPAPVSIPRQQVL
jgi:L-Ala-D/L-Glu epimerase